MTLDDKPTGRPERTLSGTVGAQTAYTRSRRSSVLRRLIDGLSVTTAVVAALAVAVMMIAIVADVLRRQFFGSSISGVFETSEVLMVFVVFFSLGFAQLARSHVEVDLITQWIPERVAAALEGAVLAAVALLLLWMAYRSGLSAIDSFQLGEHRFGQVRVPLWPARFALPVGFFAMATQCLAQSLGSFDKFRTVERMEPSPTRIGSGEE